jgi:hypothetical protein
VPVVLVGIDLVAVALLFVALGLALAIQQGLLRPVAAGLRHAPYGLGHVGNWLAGKVDDFGNGMVRHLEGWLHASLHTLTNLWHGLAALEALTMDALEELAAATEHRLGQLGHAAIAALIHTAVAPILRLAHRAEHLAQHALRVAEAGGARAEHRLAHWVRHFEHTTAAPWHAFHARVWPRAQAELHHVYSEAAYAEGVVAGELPGLPSLSVEELERMLNRVPWRTVGGMLTGGVLASYLVRALEREAGLGRPECRRNVRNICGSDPAMWESLLAGLVPLGAILSLAELAHLARPLVDELAPAIAEAE